MASTFYRWVELSTQRLFYGRNITEAQLVEEFDILTQQPSPWIRTLNTYQDLVIVLKKQPDDELVLDFLDFLVAKFGELNEHDVLEALDDLLKVGGSEWRVGTRGNFAAIEKRVPEGVHLSAGRIMETSAKAGELLSEAWHAAFGRNPDPEEAYEKAIKAVEEASVSVVTPGNKVATLGTVARDMEAQKDWALPLGEVSKHPSKDVVVKMAWALWDGQESRHGGNGYRKPTQDEAEAAVLLAVPLVQWFSAGTIARRP